MTKYVILEQRAAGESGFWDQRAELESTSDKAAISAYLKKLSADGVETSGGTFVAVPARSFKPVKVELQQRVAFK